MSLPCTCTRRRLLAVVAAALASGAVLLPPARAAELEKLVMPGEVIAAHADLESDCENCHLPFQRRDQRELCLVCHETVGQDVTRKTGFHGRSSAVSLECATCHTEHAGRDADIIGLDADTFDHTLSDFPLRGAHRRAVCAACHDEDQLHREAPSDCVDCHSDDDAHRGTLGTDCADCHDETGWRKAEFDHEATGFPLVGRHARVPCSSCHPNQQYEDAPTDCYACHNLNDVHLGRFGTTCDQCHTPRGWDILSFDHGRDTKFPLRGAHATARCEACHTGKLAEAKPQTDCYSCHRTDDEHKGRFGRDCADCHSEVSWRKLSFDHGETDFPLRGSHADVTCERCHTDTIGATKLGMDCRTCHLQDDVHGGQQGDDCALCHRETGWKRDVFFDHGLTRFPLLGLHGVATCEECHPTSAFRDAKLECAACHGADDFHERTLGPMCELCHNPNGWTFWQFDHDAQTSFPLDGAHAEQSCRDCHKREVRGSIDLPQRCGYCHDVDDVHLGSYGPDCARCHTTTSWKQLRPTP